MDDVESLNEAKCSDENVSHLNGGPRREARLVDLLTLEVVRTARARRGLRVALGALRGIEKVTGGTEITQVIAEVSAALDGSAA